MVIFFFNQTFRKSYWYLLEQIRILKYGVGAIWTHFFTWPPSIGGGDTMGVWCSEEPDVCFGGCNWNKSRQWQKKEQQRQWLRGIVLANKCCQGDMHLTIPNPNQHTHPPCPTSLYQTLPHRWMGKRLIGIGRCNMATWRPHLEALRQAGDTQCLRKRGGR